MSETTVVPSSLLGHLRGTANAFYMTALSASQGPSEELYRALRERIERPKIGDLVVEISSYSGAGDNDDPNAIGYLLDMDGDEPRGDVKIQTLDGREVAWTNCRFIGFPNRWL